jgi:hypothetical protein
MKKLLLMAALSAFVAAPAVACDMEHMDKGDKAEQKSGKTPAKLHAKAGKNTKDAKTVALVSDKKAKD